jgi:hypothetical protein
MEEHGAETQESKRGEIAPVGGVYELVRREPA